MPGEARWQLSSWQLSRWQFIQSTQKPTQLRSETVSAVQMISNENQNLGYKALRYSRPREHFVRRLSESDAQDRGTEQLRSTQVKEIN